MSDQQQTVLGRYRLIERIASGGTAEVWRALDLQLDRPVAVKRLHPHLLPDEASRKRLTAEARAAAGLSHPVIVGIYDVDGTGDSPALVMELVDGESLGARITRDGPLDPRRAVAIAAGLADALFHAHTRGVIHRDVKPGNVLLSSDGSTRLVDFGIAHSLAASAERLTLTGTVIGTLHSMAPEQLAAGPITPRTDLYGLGVVLHEALTGQPPYPAASPVALAEAQRAGPPSMAGIEPALAAVIAGCLAFDPADRPLHAGALATALRDWLAGDPSAAHSLAPDLTSAQTQPVPRVVPAVVPAAPPSEPPASRRSSAPRPWWIAPLAGLAVLLLLGSLAWAAFRPELGGLDASQSATPSTTPSATATATVAATATPAPTPASSEWFARLIEDIAKHCDERIAADAAAQMAGMSEKDARDYADDLKKECRGDDD